MISSDETVLSSSFFVMNKFNQAISPQLCRSTERHLQRFDIEAVQLAFHPTKNEEPRTKNKERFLIVHSFAAAKAAS